VEELLFTLKINISFETCFAQKTFGMRDNAVSQLYAVTNSYKDTHGRMESPYTNQIQMLAVKK
jgi:hypothetical protein